MLYAVGGYTPIGYHKPNHPNNKKLIARYKNYFKLLWLKASEKQNYTDEEIKKLYDDYSISESSCNINYCSAPESTGSNICPSVLANPPPSRTNFFLIRYLHVILILLAILITSNKNYIKLRWLKASDNYMKIKEPIKKLVAGTAFLLAMAMPIKSQQLPEPTEVFFNKATNTVKHFDIDGWKGSYELNFREQDKAGRLATDGWIKYSQPIRYYPDNPEKNITPLIGPDHPAFEKFKIVSVDFNINMIVLESLKSPDEMKDTDIARIEIRNNNYELRVYQKNGELTWDKYLWGTWVNISGAPSIEATSNEKFYEIEIVYGNYRKSHKIDPGFSYTLPLGRFRLNFDFPDLPSIATIHLESVAPRRVTLQVRGKNIDTTFNRNLVLTTENRDGMSITDLESTMGVHPYKISYTMQELFLSTDGTVYYQLWDAGYPAYRQGIGGITLGFPGNGRLFKNQLASFSEPVYGSNIKPLFVLYSDANHRIFLPFNPSSDSSGAFVIGDRISTGKLGFYTFSSIGTDSLIAYDVRSVTHNKTHMRVIDSTHALIKINVPDYALASFICMVPGYVTSVPSGGKEMNFSSNLYPNPASGFTTLRFITARAGMVDVKIYDALGKPVKRVMHEELPPGEHELPINAAALAPGIYIIHAKTPDGSFSSKLMVFN